MTAPVMRGEAPRGLLLVALAVSFLLVLTGCGGADEGADSAGADTSTGAAKHPDVLKVELSEEGGESYHLEVTMSSEYDTPDRYADGWRVLDPAGNVLGTMKLGHDHASEQPFTRTQTDLTIPSGVSKVTFQGRDQSNGYGGKTVTVAVPAE